MEREDRNLLLLGTLIILVVLIGFYFLLLGPLRSDYAQKVEEKNNKQTQLNQIRQQVGNLEEVRRNSPEIERQLLELAKEYRNNRRFLHSWYRLKRYHAPRKSPNSL